ncbi:MAG: hypothetical protein VB778_02930 [Nitrospinaceae bacterium]
MVPSDLSPGYTIKSFEAKSFADWTTRFLLDSRIRKNITHIKYEQPKLILGKTHCHSTFSNGTHSFKNIFERTVSLRLDYVVTTDHLIPGKFLIESLATSLKE